MRWSESETQFSHTIENFWSTAGKTIKKGVCRNCHRSKTAQVHLGSSHTSKMKVKENFLTFSHKFFFFYMPNISFCDGRAQLTHTTFCSPPLQPCIEVIKPHDKKRCGTTANILSVNEFHLHNLVGKRQSHVKLFRSRVWLHWFIWLSWVYERWWALWAPKRLVSHGLQGQR